MEMFREVMCGWSWEENKLFEVALAVVDEQHPERWQVVAAMVGGDKSAEDVEKHYVMLVEDLKVIESGKFDHEFGHQLQSGGAAAQSVFWTDEDSNLLVQLNLN